MVNIDQMPAGRELDALVAERVMGCKVRRRIFDGVGGTPSEPESFTELSCQCPTGPRHSSSGGTNYYSTDIAAAWEVVEKVRDLVPAEKFSVDWVSNNMTNKWQAGWWGGGVPVLVCGEDTAPLAICRVALTAAREKCHGGSR